MGFNEVPGRIDLRQFEGDWPGFQGRHRPVQAHLERSEIVFFQSQFPDLLQDLLAVLVKEGLS